MAKTIEELRNLLPISGRQVSVAGYFSPGDGGGGVFNWVVGSSALVDNGIIFSSNRPGYVGRWVRKIKFGLSPRMFGARVDGVSDDRVPLQAMFDAAAQYPRVLSLRFPPGTYFLSSARDAAYPTGNRAILELGHIPLTNRPLHLIGYGARLFSTLGPRGVPIVLVRGSFKRFTVTGLAFEKDSTPTTWSDDPSEGLLIFPYDVREIDSVDLKNCVFTNCHRAFSVGEWVGNAYTAKLKRMTISGCKILYPFGANAVSGTLPYTGQQMSYGGDWIDSMQYYDNLFDGASAGALNELTCPGRRRPDGTHFGAPCQLIFQRNTVRNYDVEGIFKTAEHVFNLATNQFTMPAVDATVQLRLSEYRESDCSVGRRLYAPNVGYFAIQSYDRANRLVTVRNLGGALNLAPGTSVPASILLFDLDYPRRTSIISDNVVDGTSEPHTEIGPLGNFPASYGILVYDTHARVYGNKISGVIRGIGVTGRGIPDRDETEGSIVEHNEITTTDSALITPNNTCALYVDSRRSVIAGNRIIIPRSERAYGMYVQQPECLVVGNQIAALQKIGNGPFSGSSSAGILFYGSQTGTVIHNNSTSRFDLGAGPEGPIGGSPYFVGDHESTEDTIGLFRASNTRDITSRFRRQLDAAGTNGTLLRRILFP